MKKLLFFACFFASAVVLSAQDYIPLVQEQATWVIHEIDYGGTLDDNILYGYRIEGDTLIGGTAYKKVYRLSFFNAFANPQPPFRKSAQTLLGAIREDLDERRVYARIFEENDLDHRCIDSGAEKLWYDYSLTVGDTLPSCISYSPEPGDIFPVDAIDTAFLFGENRRRWSVMYGYAFQVEGLGTHTGLFDPYFGYYFTADYSYYLRHFCIGPEPECDIIDATATREELLPASVLKVFPNPATDQFRVVLDAPAIGIESVSLYNISGALLVEVPGDGSNTLDLDVRGAPPGVYLLHVITSKGLAVSRVVMQNNQ